MNPGHLIAITVIADLSESKFILRANALPEAAALLAQEGDAFGSTEPSAHSLRLHAVPFPRRNEIIAELDHVDNRELNALRQTDRTHRLTARSNNWRAKHRHFGNLRGGARALNT
jgi:hypothetical protein